MKHQRLPAVLLSAFTGVGGHFLNQRWDRALLFFGLFGLLLFLGVVTPFLSFYLNPPGTWFLAGVGASILGMGLTWLVSLIITWRDSNPQRLAPPLRWTLSARVGATLASLLGAVILAFVLMQSSMTLLATKSVLRTEDSVASHDRTPQRRGKSFWLYLSLGGLRETPDALPAPPSGSGLFVGKFVYEGKPAAGVTLTLSLNGKYRATDLRTDAQGRFTLKLPPGDWYINHIQTESWDERPDDDEFILVGGTEGRLRDNDYDRPWRGEGLKVTVNETPPTAPQTFIIRKRPVLLWPTKGDQQVQTTHKAATIRWQAYPQATDYVVRIARVQRIDRGASYSSIVSRRVNAKTELALSELRAVPGAASGHIYQVTLTAFAADGSFLSETESSMDGQSFTLTDVQMLADNKLALVSTEKQLVETIQNRKRLDAAQVLIEEGLLGEAEKALATVRGATDSGNKDALMGYLRARQGRCAEATKFFDQATAANGKTCVPDNWRVCKNVSKASPKSL